MAQAFGEPAFPVDTHIHRLAARWGLSNGKNVEQTERDLKKLFPRERVGPRPPADHLLRPRALPGARPRRRGVPDLLLGVAPAGPFPILRPEAEARMTQGSRIALVVLVLL